MISLTSAGEASPLVLSTPDPQPIRPPLTSGIPASFANPMETAFDRPWDEQQKAQKAAADAKQAAYLQKLDAALLAPDAFFAANPLNTALETDPEAAKRGVLNQAFIQYHNRGPVPAGAFGLELARRSLADKLFSGRGADSEEAFHAEIVKDAQGRKEQKAIGESILTAAGESALLASVDPAKNSRNWKATREAIKAMPGYTPRRDADYMEAFREKETATKELIEDYTPQLSEVWAAMKQGGAGTFTEVLKHGMDTGHEYTGGFIAAAAPVKTLKDAAGRMVKEAGREDAPAVAFRIYNSLPEAKQSEFMDALGLLAKTMPKEEKAAFFANLSKQGGRDVDALARNAGDAAVMNSLSGISPLAGTMGQVMTMGSGQDAQIKEIAAKGRAEYLARKDFASDVRRIEQENFNPVKSAWGDKKIGMLEGGLYGIPGALASTAEAAIPIFGLPVMYHTMQGAAYDDLRQQLLSAGMSRKDASHYADQWAPLAAIPQTLLEKVEAGAWTGKLPGLGRAITAMDNGIKNRLARFAAKAAIGGIYETTIEMGQNVIPSAVQDLAFSLGQEVPDVKWTGKGGALDGFWTQAGTTLVSMFPLAMFGAVGGMNREARTRAFARASTLERKAFGFSDEHNAAIDAAAAQGQSSLNRAVDEALAGRDPTSEGAAAATSELAKKLLLQAAAIEHGQVTGMMPTIVQTQGADGAIEYRVLDGETKDEVGTADTREGAIRLAQAHSAALDAENSDKVGYIASMLEGGEEALAMAPGSQAANSFETSTVYTEATAAAESPASIDQFHSQAATQEQIDGGTGEVSMIALGRNVEDLRGDVRTFTNRLFSGASLATVIHEMGHGMLRKLEAAGVIDHAEKLAFVRAVDTVLQGKATRRDPGGAQKLALLPEGIADADVTPGMLNEAISHILEAELIRTRKMGKADKAIKLSPGVISRNFSSLAKMIPGTAGKFKAFANAVRGLFGLSTTRALIMRKAIRDGTLDAAGYQEFIDKITGRDYQTEHASMVGEEQAAIAGEDAPFSLARSNPAFDFKADMKAQVEWLLDIALEKGHSSLEEWINQDYESYKVDCEKWREAHPRGQGTDTDSAGNPERTGGSQGEVSGGLDAPANVAGIDPKRTSGATIDDATGLPLNPDGTVTLYQGTTKEAGPKIIATKELRADAERRIYLTTDPTYETGYGDGTVVAVNVRPEILELDDEFPDGRKDFAIDAPKKKVSVSDAWLHFEKSSPADSGASPFSLAPSRMVMGIEMNALGMIRNPLKRAKAFQRMSGKLQGLRLAFERLELVAGAKRRKTSLKKEAAMREAIRREELIEDAMKRHVAVMSDADILKLKSQPVHQYLADPDSPLRGRLMSKSAALKKHPDMFQVNRPGEYDGADGISRAVFGGALMPDQAAQELFENHLIKEPTADAMWDAIRREQAFVDGMKEAMAKGLEAVAQAKAQAKAETNAWLEEQGANQDANFSDKQEILRALATLDAVLSIAPPEIRGKLGGYTQLARLGSNEQRMAFLKDRLATLDAEMEAWLKRVYHAEFMDLLKRAKPSKDAPGEKPTGKIGADIHDLFRDVERAMRMTSTEADALATMQETMAASGDYSADREAHMQTLAGLIRLVGAWYPSHSLHTNPATGAESYVQTYPGADAARMEEALIEATRVFENGYGEARVAQAQKREARRKTTLALGKATNKAGLAGARDKQEIRDATTWGKIKEWRFGLGSFDQLLTHIFGEKSADAQRYADAERWASDRKADAVFRHTDAITDLFTELAGGGLAGEKLRWAMAQKVHEVGSGTNKRTLSQLQMITASLMWRQEDGRRHMLGRQDENGNYIGASEPGVWHYDQAFMDDVEAALTPEAKAVRLFLIDQYASEYDRLNAVYRNLYGVNLPRHKFYSPLTVNPKTFSGNFDADPLTGAISGGGFTPGSLKTRSADAIAEPDFRDSLHTYIAHVKQIEHWIAYAPLTQEMHLVLNNSALRAQMEEKAGKEAISVLAKWVEHFSLGGNRDANAHIALTQGIGSFTNRAAGIALVGRAGVLAIQSVQLGAGLAEMPTGSYVKRLGMLTSGQLGWGAALDTQYIQRRLKQQPPIVQQALQGLRSAKPSRLKHVVARLGTLISGADALFTAGTYAICYDYHLTQGIKNGLTQAEAEKNAHAAAERACDRIAQPTRPGARSLYENTSTGPLARLSWAFGSEARQKLAIFAFTLANPDASIGRKARAVSVAWLVGGGIATLIRTAWRDMRDHDDDEWFDEKNWNPWRLGMCMLTGPLQGLPVVGSLIEASAFKATGQYLPEGNLLSNIARAWGTLDNVPKWFTGERDFGQALGDAEVILSGMGILNDSLAAAASLSHIARDAFGLAEDMMGD